jgi:hypothetical protein
MGKPLGRLASIHRNGPGLKKLGNAGINELSLPLQ